MSLTVVWMSYERGKAHLILSTSPIHDAHRYTAICGQGVDTYAPYAGRCQSCLALLAEISEVATQPPPKRITERVVLIIQRNAEGEPIREIIKRKLKPLTSIKIVSLEVEDLGAVKEEE